MFTKKGIIRAEEVIQKYEFFKDLLLRLGIDEQKARQDAEKLEHDAWSFSALKACCKL